MTDLRVKNIVPTDAPVKRQITDSIRDNFTDSDLEGRNPNLETFIHSTLFLVIWYWSSSQLYNVVGVNFIFSMLLNIISWHVSVHVPCKLTPSQNKYYRVTKYISDFKWKRELNWLKALLALRNTFSSCYTAKEKFL